VPVRTRDPSRLLKAVGELRDVPDYRRDKEAFLFD